MDCSYTFTNEITGLDKVEIIDLTGLLPSTAESIEYILIHSIFKPGAHQPATSTHLVS